MLDKRIVFEERYEDKNENTITLYFSGPKELLPFEPEAVAVKISVECPVGMLEAKYASVEMSPVDSCGECYDWRDTNLPSDEVEELFTMQGKEG